MAKKYTKRADGRYATTIKANEIDPKTEKRKTIYIYGRTIRELEEKKAQILEELEKGIYTSSKDILFSEYKWEWFETYKTGRAYNTQEGYRNILKNHLGCLDNLYLKAIRKSDVQKGYNLLRGKPDLQRRYRQTVNQILKTAIDDGYLVVNVAANLELDIVKKKKRRALTKVEREAIQKADFTLKEKCFVLLLQYTGMRREEVVPLSRFNIDFSKRMITVNKVVEFIGEKPNLKDPKTEASERKIPILEPLFDTLKEYTHSLETTLLFPGTNYTYMAKYQYRNLFMSVKRKINLAAGGKHEWKNGKTVFVDDRCKGLTSHVFRHEFATILYYSGLDLLDAIDIFGHADVQVMLDIYVELRIDSNDSREKIDEYLKTYLTF